MKPHLYDKELVGHTREQKVYLLRPILEAKLFLFMLHKLKVERRSAWSHLDYEDRKGI